MAKSPYFILRHTATGGIDEIQIPIKGCSLAIKGVGCPFELYDDTLSPAFPIDEGQVYILDSHNLTENHSIFIKAIGGEEIAVIFQTLR